MALPVLLHISLRNHYLRLVPPIQHLVTLTLNNFLTVVFVIFSRYTAFQTVFNNSLSGASVRASVGGGLSVHYGVNGTNAAKQWTGCISMVPRILSILQFWHYLVSSARRLNRNSNRRRINTFSAATRISGALNFLKCLYRSRLLPSK